MLTTNSFGYVLHPRIKIEMRPLLEKGPMTAISGIIVHQTDAATAKSSLDQYKVKDIGAHFLIDKDGTIYETAAVTKRVNHVGRLKARCIEEHRCAAGEEAKIGKMSYSCGTPINQKRPSRSVIHPIGTASG